MSTVNTVEVAYRQGIKQALSIRESVNTEIVYIESGKLPLYIRISKQQLKFWTDLQVYLAENPDHPLVTLINQGRELNLSYLNHYIKLENKFTTPLACATILRENFLSESSTKIRQKSNGDNESRLGMYLLVNPQLVAPSLVSNTLEFERIMITRYRTGSHNLRIETGRMCNPTIPREQRVCTCNTGVQSLSHCLFDCSLLQELRVEYSFGSIDEALNSPLIPKFLLKMEKVLNIQNFS